VPEHREKIEILKNHADFTTNGINMAGIVIQNGA